jgi:hypothetical protein
VATAKSIIHPFPAQGRAPLSITSLQISQYAELTALISQLEAQQKTLRKELLTLRSAGAEQGTDSPFMLAFVDQERRTVDWKDPSPQPRRTALRPRTGWRLERNCGANCTSPDHHTNSCEAKPFIRRWTHDGTGGRLKMPAIPDAIHICGKCKKDVATGRDTRGRASLCSTCDEKIKILAARLRILPSFQHTAANRIQRRGRCD